MESFATEVLQILDRAGDLTDGYAPQFEDLVGLYSRVRRQNSVAALEFGSGWSTVVIASALKENARDKPINFRHPNAFQVMSVEADTKYAEATQDLAKRLGLANVHLHHSTPRMREWNGQAVHMFDRLPVFTADFIYLDGPDAYQVLGNVHGLDINFGDEVKVYGLPMAADLLLMEPFFWPGTMLVVDGRGGNSSLLRHGFQRNWKYSYDSRVDQHEFFLDEEPWGVHSQAMMERKKS